MKKILILFVFCFVFSSLCLFADDEIAWEHEEDLLDVEFPEVPAEYIAWDDDLYEDIYDDDYEKPDRPPFRFSNRTFELGLLGVNINFSNDFLTLRQIFTETLVLNLDDLRNGLGIKTGVLINPIFFSYNKNDNWGFGLTTGLDVWGNVNLAGEMLTISEAVNAKSDVGAAVFADLQINSFFHIPQLKVKFRPSMSLYFPILYARANDFSYTFRISKNDDGIDVTQIRLGYDILAYTAFPLEGDGFSLSASPGVDWSIGAEFPLAQVLELDKRFPFLNFIVGVDFINIPLVPAVMNDYLRLTGVIETRDEPLDLENISDMDSLFNIDTGEMVYGEERQTVFRPFKMHMWADWQPFETRENIIITFTPTLGFAINPLYQRPFSLEAGIKAHVDLWNLLLPSFEMGYYDRRWMNNLALGLNLRAFQFDAGIGFHSPSFAKSWSGGGFAVNLGLRFGW
jgi:hypothetical protein